MPRECVWYCLVAVFPFYLFEDVDRDEGCISGLGIGHNFTQKVVKRRSKRLYFLSPKADCSLVMANLALKMVRFSFESGGM